MNTSLPLLNVITGSQAATGSRSANPADSFSADVPFNQVLNSQVNNRSADKQPQDQARAADNAPKPSQPAAASPQKSSTSDATEKKQDVKEDDKDGDDVTPKASAELLALVANLEQNAVKPVSSGTDQDKDADLLAQSKRGGARLPAQLNEQGAAPEGKDKPGSFSATGDKFGNNNASKEAASESAQPTTDAAGQLTKTDKASVDLSAATKALPKEDSNALSAHVPTAKVTPELANAKDDLPPAAPAVLAAPVTPQVIAAAQPAVFATTFTDKIQPNVGSAGWDQAVGQKVTWMVNGGIQSASLTLNPPDLGPMQVVLNVHNQQADATFITAQPEVKQALEAAMPKLREMMDQAGIQLGQATVNTGMPHQHQGAHDQQSRTASSGSFAGSDEEGADSIAATGSAVASSSGLGLVDTFA